MMVKLMTICMFFCTVLIVRRELNDQSINAVKQKLENQYSVFQLKKNQHLTAEMPFNKSPTIPIAISKTGQHAKPIPSNSTAHCVLAQSSFSHQAASSSQSPNVAPNHSMMNPAIVQGKSGVIPSQHIPATVGKRPLELSTCSNLSYHTASIRPAEQLAFNRPTSSDTKVAGIAANYDPYRIQHASNIPISSYPMPMPMYAVPNYPVSSYGIPYPQLAQSQIFSHEQIGSQLSHPMHHEAPPKARRVRALPVNDEGRLILPVVLGRANSRVSIYSIGEIAYSTPNLHNSKFIYPIGFVSKRKFSSFSDPAKRITYTCKIVNSNASAANDTKKIVPLFQICPQNESQGKIESDNIATLWSLFKACFHPIETFTEFSLFSSPEEFFGLDHEGVKKYIQELPNAQRCIHYIPVPYLTRASSGRRQSASSLSQSPAPSSSYLMPQIAPVLDMGLAIENINIVGNAPRNPLLDTFRIDSIDSPSPPITGSVQRDSNENDFSAELSCSDNDTQ